MTVGTTDLDTVRYGTSDAIRFVRAAARFHRRFTGEADVDVFEIKGHRGLMPATVQSLAGFVEVVPLKRACGP